MLAHASTGLPSDVPGLNWHRLRASRAASSSRVWPLDDCTSLDFTRPSTSIRNRRRTVPFSPSRADAGGYGGFLQFRAASMTGGTRTGSGRAIATGAGGGGAAAGGAAGGGAGATGPGTTWVGTAGAADVSGFTL